MAFADSNEKSALPVGSRIFVYGAPRPTWTKDGVLELGIDFSKYNKLQRAFWDIPFKHDLSSAVEISFEYKCDDLSPIMRTFLYFQSGKGWYKGLISFETQGKWTKMRFRTEDISTPEDSPAGLSNVSAIRLACSSADKTKTTLKLRNFQIKRIEDLAEAPKILLLRSDHSGNVVPSQRKSFIAFASRFADILFKLGLPFEQVSDLDLTAEKLAGKSLLILPYNRFLPKEKAQLIRDFSARGGKLLTMFYKTQWIEDVIGIKSEGSYVARKEGDDEIVGFLKCAQGLPNQPVFASNRAWSAVKVVTNDQCRVWATWTDEKRKRTDIPAIIETKNGIFISYVFTGGAFGGCGELIYSLVSHLVPSLQKDIDNLRNKRNAEKVLLQKQIDSMPGREGERRLAWCINPFGLDGSGDWERTAQFLQQHNFTDLIVCFARAGIAFYDSKVLPVSSDVATKGDQLEKAKAACKRHGIRLHAWKMCWTVGKEKEAMAFYASAEKENRVLVSASQKKPYKWLCPGDKQNQDIEIAAMTELAMKGVDGVQFDFIRYVDGGHCFCIKCRERFEKIIGQKISKWPNDVIKGPFADAWVKFRCDNITRVVRETHANVRKKAKGVEISAAVFSNADHDITVVGQDWSSWCREGLLDFVCPMNYTSNSMLFNTLVRIQTRQHGKAKLYPGIGLSDYSSWRHDDTDAYRLASQIEIVRKFGLEGFTLFELDNNAVNTLPHLLKGPLSK